MSDIKQILLILQEECAEVIQAISKCERFGDSNYKPGKQKTNKDHFEEELGDLLAMIELLEEKEYINMYNVQTAKVAKFNKLKQWSTIQID